MYTSILATCTSRRRMLWLVSLAFSQSVLMDFLVKSTGMGHADISLMSQLPIPQTSDE